MTIADSLNQLKMEMHMQRQNEFLMYGYGRQSAKFHSLA